VKKSTALLFCLALPASSLSGQVGYDPARSPYVDLEYKQEFTVFTGGLRTGSDPSGAAPRTGPMLGFRYETRVGGPASFTARAARVFSERQIVDPAKPLSSRYSAPKSWPLYLLDASLSINLTGQKSIRHIVPVVNSGVGIVSDFKSGADVGGYRFGTTFAFSFGGGVRWTPGGPFQLRADFADYLYQLTYPSTYYVKASDSTSVLRGSDPKSVWKHNMGLTVGASYLFFR
jgi:hypothetical protein